MRRRCVLVSVLGMLAMVLVAPETARGKGGPPAADVQKAIRSGAAWLQAEFKDGFEGETWHSTPELVVLTLTHAGVSPKDKILAKGLETIEACELEWTYRVSVLAMALSRINPYKYRARLAHCAQWLVDTQLPGGEWGYPGTIQGRKVGTRAMKVEPPVVPEAQGPPGKQPPIVISRKLDPATLAGRQGDFSNTQFALLGLRACRDARIEIPEATWQAALDYQLKWQREDGGWGYAQHGEQDEASFASLTCAGIVGVAIALHGLGKRNPRSHPAVKKGLGWLKRHWDPSENVGIDRSTFIPPSTWQYYHLYSVERVGRVLGLKKIANLDWYAVGATNIVMNQNADGSWSDPGGDITVRRRFHKVADTCFAILFLSLATPPLTSTGR